MNIQDKMQEIHHKYGVSEKANYEIEKFVEKLIEDDRAEQLILHNVSKRTWKYSYDSDFTTVEFELTFADDEDPYEMAKQIVGTNKADYLNYEVKD